MTKLQRISSFLMGIVMLGASVLLMVDRNDAYTIIIFFLSLGLFVLGAKHLFYYITMARFMTGGKISLYKGLVLLDLSFLTGSISDIPRIYLLIYLAVIHGFSGLVEVLRALEARRYGAKSWRLKLFQGSLDAFMALSCIVFFRRPATAVIIYSLGLIYSAVLRIISALRRGTFVYIQ